VLDAIEERDAGAARERLVAIILASRRDMEHVLPAETASAPKRVVLEA